MRASALLLALALPALGVVSLPLPVQAQDEVAELKARFKEGLALEEEGKWAEALGIFSTIAEKRRSPQVVFHVALCQEQTGRWASALDSYAEAISLAKADAKAAPEVLENAPPRMEALRARTPRIVLVPNGQTRTIVLDGTQLPPISEETEIVVDPGKHRVVVRENDGEETVVRNVVMSEGQTTRIDVDKKVAAKPTAPAPPKQNDQVEPGNLVPGLVVGGVGVAALALSGVFIGLRQAAISEVRDGCANGDTGCAPELAEVADRGRTYEVLAWSAAGAGVAAVGVGLILVFTIGQDRVVPAKTKLTTRLVVSATGAFLTGAFE